MIWGENKNLGRSERYGRKQGGDFFGCDEMVGSDEDARRSRDAPVFTNVPGGFKKTG
jgi:hypothetical protein